ncbi:MAG: LamG-like jellyroll fold domain-containing protein [bacterium]|nr:LamG-like jellyroll fold domain-containing protein [bacterium]
MGTSYAQSTLDVERSESDYLSAGDAYDPSGTMSVFTWIKMESLPSTTGYIFWVVNKDDESDGRAFAFGLTDTNKLYLQINGSHINWGNTALSSTGTWYHIGFTFNDLTGNVEYFLNGISDGTESTGASLSATTAGLDLGRRSYSGSESYTDGILDEVVITNTILSTTTIAALYNGGAGIEVCVTEWCDGATVLSGTISASTTWTVADSPYVVTSTVTIATGTTVIVEPGAIIKFKDDQSLIVNGILDVRGTTSNMAYFTGYKDDSVGGDTNTNGTSTGSAGDWGQIQIGSGASSTITGAIIRYGGSDSTLTDSMLEIYGGVLFVNNSAISDSEGFGLYSISSGTTTINNVQIYGNLDGIGISGGIVTVTSSSIFKGYEVGTHSSSSYGAIQTGSPSSTMINNYWGGWIPLDLSTTTTYNPGPYHTLTNATGAGTRVTDYITYSPYAEHYLYNPLSATTSPSAVNDLNLLIGIDTQYTSSSDRAVIVWRNATSGLISMATTTATSSVDLVVKDVFLGCNCAIGCTAGYWEEDTSPPTVNINVDAVNNCPLNAAQKINLIMHEMGHSMGLAHSPFGNLMYRSVTEKNDLSPQDYKDYNFRWGNWWADLWANLLE